MNNQTVKLLTEITDLSKINYDENYLYPGNIFANCEAHSPQQKSNKENLIELSSDISEEGLSLENFQEKQTSSSESLMCAREEAPVKSGKIFQIRKDSKRVMKLHILRSYSEDKGAKAITKSSSLASTGTRKDVEYKTALRLLKRFFKNSYKSQSRDISDKMHRKLSIEDIYVRMKVLLSSFVPQEFLTEDLIYYTIGITCIKNITNSSCQKTIKNEVAAFQNCVHAFSRKKFKNALASDSLVTLCCYIIQKLEDPRIRVLRDEVLAIMN
ncbi:unnamed protein product [Moneuplotes crassus]|uniref:Uncharacterized protein n=1 Tax=Euplotes crassus TaxID=5936 RepID=A0AAD1Y5Y0_EUPCR|nr:unnamed protein product [Moneuplotes crassus]